VKITFSIKSSKIRELEEKVEKCEIPISWHYIGRLQKSNINRLIRIKGLTMIETIDSVEVARFLAERIKSEMDVLIQVNITNEPQKGGCAPLSVWELAKYILTDCPKLRLRGLMGIGMEGFPLLKTLFEEGKILVNTPYFNTLSMGMSDDYKEALQLGSNNVRLGIF
jgi:PLP dependent protein